MHTYDTYIARLAAVRTGRLFSEVGQLNVHPPRHPSPMALSQVGGGGGGVFCNAVRACARYIRPARLTFFFFFPSFSPSCRPRRLMYCIYSIYSTYIRACCEDTHSLARSLSLSHSLGTRRCKTSIPHDIYTYTQRGMASWPLPVRRNRCGVGDGRLRWSGTVHTYCIVL